MCVNNNTLYETITHFPCLCSKFIAFPLVFPHQCVSKTWSHRLDFNMTSCVPYDLLSLIFLHRWFLSEFHWHLGKHTWSAKHLGHLQATGAGKNPLHTRYTCQPPHREQSECTTWGRIEGKERVQYLVRRLNAVNWIMSWNFPMILATLWWLHTQNKQQAGGVDVAVRMYYECHQNLLTSQRASYLTRDTVVLFTSQCSGVNNPICICFLWGWQC